MNTPVAWSYEQAHTKISDGYETQYGDWRHHVSVDKPDVPDEAIRNLRTLAYTQSDTICTSVNTLEDTVSLDLDANQRHTDAWFDQVRQNDIIRMAREAGFTDYYPERLTRFFNLAFAAGVKHGCEEAAKVVETTPWSNWFQGDCVTGIRNLIK